MEAEVPAEAVAWEPNPGPQTAFVSCPVFEVLYGGARGGGKTDGVLGEWLRHASLYGEAAIGLMVRRELTQLIETIERSRQIYSLLGARFHEQDKLWRLPNGARLRFAYLERDADADAYQGHSYTRVYVEEIGTFPSPTPILKLMATLRSGRGVPVGFRATGNPGGPGQSWVKARYIDGAPMGWAVSQQEYRNPFTGEMVMRDRVYIPARVTENPHLGVDYVANLQMSGTEALVRAWLEGDWDVIDGAFFDRWSSRMVLRPFAVPAHWPRSRSLDWGYAKPFSVGWWALAEEDHAAESSAGLVVIPKGSLVRYREWYGARDPDVGLRLDAEDVAKGIVEREHGEKILYGVADPSMWGTTSGPSPAERMGNYKHPKLGHEPLLWRKADNKRVTEKGALGGWDQMRARMRGVETEDGSYAPLIYCFSTCADSVRTIPVLQHDKNRPEDVDSEMEDHAADEWRYECMSRPLSQLQPPRPAPAHPLSVVRIFADEEKPRSRYRV